MHAELQISRLERVQQNSKSCSAIGYSSCVDRSTYEKPDFGVSKSKIRVSHPPTQQIFAVRPTRCVSLLRRPIFPCVVIFRRTYFRVDMACCH